MSALGSIRILDLTNYYAGPYCGWLLGSLGAEVIKVESCSHPEPLRLEARGLYPAGGPGEQPWNRSAFFNERNRNKYGITLELTTAKGKEIFLNLVKISDVILENFQADVMQKLGVTYPVLQKINPAVIMVSLSSQGLSGPERSYRSFGPNLEQIGGMTSISGYPDEPPYISSLSFPDPLGGMYGVTYALAAILHRRKTGKGTHIEVSQREASSSIIGEAIMDYTMNKRVWKSIGNRHRFMAPQGCYRCKGEDRWVTVAVSSDQEWRTLCEVMRNNELVNNRKFSNVLGRYTYQDEIDRIIETWTIEQDHYEVQAKLQSAGIASAAVLDAEEVYADPHYKDRGYFQKVMHPQAGSHAHPGLPIKLSKMQAKNHMAAPCLGEHNAYVYGKLLGLTQQEIAKLESDGIIGTAPTADARRLIGA